jgi:hypothetical protein
LGSDPNSLKAASSCTIPVSLGFANLFTLISGRENGVEAKVNIAPGKNVKQHRFILRVYEFFLEF